MKNVVLFFLLSILSDICWAQKKISIDDLWTKNTFQERKLSGFNFLKDGRSYVEMKGDKILQYDIATGEMLGVFFDLRSIEGKKNIEIDGYMLNSDEDLILLRGETEAIYRRSSKSIYFLVSKKENTAMPIYEGRKLMYATFSPDGEKLAFVYNNNLYIYFIDSRTTKQITHDGKKNHIINGSADWVYEEEFSFAKAFFWNIKSSHLAYYRFNESMVSEISMTLYDDESYPVYEKFKYPKVGEKNSEVEIRIYDLKTAQTSIIPKDLEASEYIPRIKWTKDENELAVYNMNRHQNHLKLNVYNAVNATFKTILEEKNPYYIDIDDNLRFLENGNDFLWTSEADGYHHIYLYDIKTGRKQQLTQGIWDVTKFYGIDEKKKYLYYQSAEITALERQVYRLNMKTLEKENLTPRSGVNDAQFSKTFDYWVWSHSATNSPRSYCVMNLNDKCIRSLEQNDDLKGLMKEYHHTDQNFFVINSGGQELNAWMIKPADFDENKSYPLLMYVYGGPGSQTVKNEFGGMNHWWFQMLSQKGYIVVSVDNRGTGARGQEFKKTTYLQLGKYELEDQTNAAIELGKLTYIDAERIGIFGWSYGAYLSSLCLFKSNDIFTLGIAVAPVTNWKWYDTIYTERYMRTFSENPEAYKQNSPVYFANDLEGKYLLIHGMADDNVHFQNTVELTNALIRANKQFQTYFYPNRNHGIYGANSRRHLYTKMTTFILNNL